jgi:hypothetical protein
MEAFQRPGGTSILQGGPRGGLPSRRGVVRFITMSHTLSIRLTSAQADWLKETAARAGVPQSRIIREQLERAMANTDRPFMALAGAASGPRNLSERKGFSRP